MIAVVSNVQKKIVINRHCDIIPSYLVVSVQRDFTKSGRPTCEEVLVHNGGEA